MKMIVQLVENGNIENLQEVNGVLLKKNLLKII